MSVEPSSRPLRTLEKEHGAAETLRRWKIYLSATPGSFASAQKFAATWGEWGATPEKGRTIVTGPAGAFVAEAAALWTRYKTHNLLTRWQRSEYEAIGATLVAAALYPDVASFLDELRITQPWTLGDARTDGYAINELARRLAEPRKAVA